MRIKLNIGVDVEAALDQAVGNVSSLSGLGADGTSEYEVTGYDVSSLQSDGTYTVSIEIERVSGKFATKDELVEAFQGELGETLYDVPLEVQ